MKAAILLAGMSRRMGDLTKDAPKSLTQLQEKPLLGHLLDRIVFAGFTSLTPIVGYKANMITDFLDQNYASDIEINPVLVQDYDKFNNLHSLVRASDQLEGNQFILINGDMIMHREILASAVKLGDESKIALDVVRKDQVIDSPGTIVKDDRIFDLGRHVPLEQNGGYALGVYKFGTQLSQAFFPEARELLAKDGDAGFHDPLITLFDKTPIGVLDSQGLGWQDLDDPSDLPKINQALLDIQNQENQ